MPHAKRDYELHCRKLTIGDTLTASVAFINNPEDFYIKIECTGFEVLMENINKFCDETESVNRYNIYKPFKKGDVCLARYADDNLWYRSEVSITPMFN